jgi:hypothetical protein
MSLISLINRLILWCKHSYSVVLCSSLLFFALLCSSLLFFALLCSSLLLVLINGKLELRCKSVTRQTKRTEASSSCTQARWRILLLRHLRRSTRSPIAHSNHHTHSAARRSYNQQNPMLWGECLSGALYVNDFIAMAKNAGFADPRLLEETPVTLNDDVGKLTGDIRFTSRTYRLFKLDLEPNCEDYGQMVNYLGTIPESPDQFILDDHHIIRKGEDFKVCGNSYKMLHDTRYAPHFAFHGSFDTHHGAFDCSQDSACATPAQSDACCAPSTKTKGCC